MARPKIKINWSLVENMCAIMCTMEEICSVLGISSDTLTRRIKDEYKQTFPEYYDAKCAQGKMSLRRIQYNSAMGTKKMIKDTDKDSPTYGEMIESDQWANNGSVTMQIWLGKQWLGQTDKQEVAMYNPIDDVEFIDDL